MLKIFANWGKPRAFNQGWLQVSEIHKIFYQELGNPQGLPVICFHGGPGYWSRAETAKKFDLRKSRVILFDQRGCGKSQPLGEVKENTTHDLVDDAAKLLKHLGIKNKVVVFGSSWGTTLALLFAEKYPQLVEKLFLSKVFLADKISREWEQRCSGWFYPDMMDEVRKPIKKEMKTAEFYYKEIMAGDLQKQLQAVNLYGSYENVLGSLQPQLGRGEVTEVEVMSCRVMMHYAANNFFLREDEIIKGIDAVQKMPVCVVHNRLDMVCPLVGAYQLKQVIPEAELHIVPDYGHGSKLLSREEGKCLRAWGI